jgi:RNA polymerase sporulation-specific sigma factor
MDKDNAELIDRLVISGNADDPQEILADKESVENLYQYIRRYLSEHERMSILLHLYGYKQQDIARKLNIHRKVVDNAIQRAKRKISQYISQNERDTISISS